MPDEFSDLRRRIREVFTDVIDNPQPMFATFARRDFDQSLWDGVARCGIFRDVVGSEYGGNGLVLHRSVVAFEELASLGAVTVFPVLTVVGTLIIEKFSSPDIKQDFLPKIAEGKLKLCFAVTEESTGFNVLELRTHATRTGNDYLLEGSKNYVSGADVADKMLVVARTKTVDQCLAESWPRSHGISVFLVDVPSADMTVTGRPIRGELTVHPCLVEFKKTSVPGSRLLGMEDQGFAALVAGFNVERILIAAIALGAARFALDTAARHAKNRRVFNDQPIGQYQAIQHPLADVAIRLEAVRLLVYKAAAAFDAGSSPKDVEFLANAGKYLASELALQAVDAAIQTLGGYGFDENRGLIQLWESMRLLKLSPISNELILNRVAEQILQLPRSR